MTRSGPDSLTVLHVSQPGDGGVAKCVRDLASDQVGRGWRVVVATPNGSELADAAETAGAEVVPWNAVRTPGPGAVSETRQLGRLIEAARPHVLHLHSSKAGLAGRLALRGRRPTIFQPHSWSFEAVDGATRTAAISWERIGARWAHAIVCVSEGERDRGLEQRIDGRYRVIPNGVDLTVFSEADDHARTRARRALRLGDEPLVVCVGRICRQKGQDRLVAAWPSVRARVADASLVLVGSGEDEHALRQRAGVGVQFAGHQTNVAEWLAAADVVAMPSRWEGMAIGLLEAMARGRSIVATDVGGAREAFARVAGAVVPAEHGAAFVDALVERLLSPDMRRAEGSAAVEQARTCYDVRTTLARTASLYSELLAGQATSR